MNNKQRKTLKRIFQRPTLSNIEYKNIESLMKALEVNVDVSRSGSRVCFEKNGEVQIIHKPHPENELKKYAVIDIKEFLLKIGVKP